MRRARVTGAIVAAVVLLGVLPGAAAPGEIRDVCGDAETYVAVGDTRQTLEASRGHVDVERGSLAGVYDGATLTGIEATIDVCGAASATDGAYQVSLRFDDACAQRLTWVLRVRDDLAAGDPASVSHEPRGVVDEYCSRYTSRPTSADSEQVFREDLPAGAVAFDGKTVTFSVPLEAIPQAGRARYTDGTRIHVSALTMDQTVSGGTFSAGATPTISAWARTDLASASQPYFVGSDRP